MKLDNDTLTLYCAKHYDTAACTNIKDFEDDCKRPAYIRRLFKRYKESGELRERIILNHLIIFFNVFESRAAINILCLTLRDFLPELKPFLVFLNFWPEKIEIIDPPLPGSDIQMDPGIVEVLRKI